MAMGGQGQYPVDNNTYNLLQMLASKLEAIEVYQKYEKDADENTRGLIQELMRDDRRHAERLMEALRRVMSK